MGRRWVTDRLNQRDAPPVSAAHREARRNALCQAQAARPDFTGCLFYLHRDAYMSDRQYKDARAYIEGFGGKTASRPGRTCTHLVTGRPQLVSSDAPMSPPAHPIKGSWAGVMAKYPQPAQPENDADGLVKVGGPRAVSLSWLWGLANDIQGPVRDRPIHTCDSHFGEPLGPGPSNPWDSYMVSATEHQLAAARAGVEPEHLDCFDSHVVNFVNWKPKTNISDGWPMLDWEGGVKGYMRRVETERQAADWPSPQQMWELYIVQFKVAVPKLHLLAYQRARKAMNRVDA